MLLDGEVREGLEEGNAGGSEDTKVYTAASGAGTWGTSKDGAAKEEL